MGSRLRIMLTTIVVAAVAVGLAPLPTGGAEPLELVSTKQLSNRLRELEFRSQALGNETSVRILLPEGFDKERQAADPLPVLWLLHGCCDDYKSWTDKGEAEKLTEDLDLVVVMPDGGRGGWYSDWYNGGRGGPPAWETYHLGELRTWVESNLPVRTDRAGRSIAGLSMGGFGAMSYAARHPDLFTVAAAYSGAVDTNYPGVAQYTDYSASQDGGQPGDIWGPRVTEETRWRSHNPVDIAANLGSVDVYLRTGNGTAGGKHGGGPDLLEAGVHQTMVSLHQRLLDLRIDHTWEDYGPGAHQWPYWAEGLELTLPRVMRAAADRDDQPATVTHLAYEPAYSVWGFTVVLDRPVLESSRLEVRADGFALTGSGRGTVTTPPRFTPGSPVDVTTAGRTTRATADGTGRVAVAVDLGPANTAPQHSPTAVATGTPQRTTEVTLKAVAVDPEAARPASDLRPEGDSVLPPTGATSAIVLIGVGAVIAVVATTWRVRRRRASP